MSSGRSHRPPSSGKVGSPTEVEGADYVPPGSTESAIAAVHRIARKVPYRVQRKAEEGKEDAEDANDVADEKEGDALRADEEKKEGGEDKEEKEGAAQEDEAGREETPQIAAKLDGVGRKIFRNKNKGKIEEHRGRLQVQGKDLKEELSWAWTRDTPPPASEAVSQLSSMRGKLSPRELALRNEAFADALGWITAKAGRGVDAPISKSFKNGNLPPKNSDARVDIEVIKGKAFV